MDEWTLGRILANGVSRENSSNTDPSKTSTIYAVAASDSIDGLVDIYLEGQIHGDIETVPQVKMDDEVIVTLVGNRIYVSGIIGEGDKSANEIQKRSRTFLDQPNPPYYAGDIWTQGGDDPESEANIYVCMTSREEGNFEQVDWELAGSGKPGKDGTDGNGIKEIVITYCASSSGTVAPTTGWQSTIPSVSASQYLWTRTVLTFDDNTTSIAYSVGMMGATGIAGAAGAAARQYIIASSVEVIQIYEDDTYSPTTLSFNSYYADGAATSRSNYAGRMQIQASRNGTAWTTISTASADSASVSVTMATIVAAVPNVTQIRCNLYAAGSTSSLLQAAVVAIVAGQNQYTTANSQGVFVHQTAGPENYTTGSNARVYSDGLEVRNGSNVLSRFTSSLIQLGLSSASAVIEMVQGAFKFFTGTDSIGSRYSTIYSDGPLHLSSPSGSVAMTGWDSAYSQPTDAGMGIVSSDGVYIDAFIKAKDISLMGQAWVTGNLYVNGTYIIPDWDSGVRWLRGPASGVDGVWYRKIGKIVTLNVCLGEGNNFNVTSAGVLIGTLPEEFRPPANVICAAEGRGANLGQVEANANGRVTGWLFGGTSKNLVASLTWFVN